MLLVPQPLLLLHLARKGLPLRLLHNQQVARRPGAAGLPLQQAAAGQLLKLLQQQQQLMLCLALLAAADLALGQDAP